MKTLILRAPGKLNLFLKVLRRRPDGYHDIFSLFHKLNIADQLEFKKTRGEACRIICQTPGVPLDGDNLIHKAFRALKEAVPFRGGLEVRLTKNIPVAGGMGGGSSDAAATLVAINRLFALGLKRQDLLLVGLRLGADVPFFIAPWKSALVSGIGERLAPFAGVGKFCFLLVCFKRGVSTRKAYEGLGLKPKALPIQAFRPRAVRGLSALRSVLGNDLARVSMRLHPELKRVYGFLSRKGLVVSQTGSGPTLFVADTRVDRLRELALELEERFEVKTVIAKSL